MTKTFKGKGFTLPRNVTTKDGFKLPRNVTTKGGFTLIELLIVIGIIAILAAAVIIAVKPGEKLAEARDSRRERDLITLESAVYIEWLDEGRAHPNIPTAEGEEDPEEEAKEICNTNIEAVVCGDLVDLSDFVPKYLPTMPVDPHGGIDPNGTGYEVVLVGNPKIALRAPKNETRGVAVGPIAVAYHVPPTLTGIFGSEPESLDGVDYFDGTPESGMIVFKTPGTYSITPEESGDVEVLVVAGGGSSSYGNGGTGHGGGGAGGLVFHDSKALNADNNVSVTVGNGGIAPSGAGDDGNNGGNSIFKDITAIGGGGGGFQPGQNGGSGGGAGGADGGASGGSAIQGNSGGGTGYGNAGASTASHAQGGAGGGGAAGSGNTYSGGTGGTGGAGRTYWGTTYAVGGTGGNNSGGNTGNNGTANKGNGATANSGGATQATSGGSGIVIIRWGDYNKNYDPMDDSHPE